MLSLDRFIKDFGGSIEPDERSLGTSALVLEHLQAAGRYLLGAARDEFRSSVQQAGDFFFSPGRWRPAGRSKTDAPGVSVGT